MRTRLRNLVLAILALCGVFRLARRFAQHRLIVLTYHHVLPRPTEPVADRPPNVLYVDEFARQLAYLVRHCHIVTGDELRAYLDGQPLPPHSVLLTFDDGYRNNYRHAFPLLRMHRAAAVFFLTSRFVGDRRRRLWFDRLDAAIASAPDAVRTWLREQTPIGRRTLPEFRRFAQRLPAHARERLVSGAEQAADHRHAHAFPNDRVEPMSWDEVREMAEAGMLIGAHTATHQILAGLAADDAMAEVATSRTDIEAQIGRECWCFSYPNGEASDTEGVDTAMLRACGFACAFTQICGMADDRSNRYTLPRVAVPSTSNFRVFLARVSGLLPLLTESTRQMRRWARAS